MRSQEDLGAGQLSTHIYSFRQGPRVLPTHRYAAADSLSKARVEQSLEATGSYHPDLALAIDAAGLCAYGA
ncbi:hypothetical protein [Thiocapsa sp.]|uniref:hypothetical protein n=1 Tax=Thiocapsa sp. TaxID=2024551 RepID=UPI001BD008CF|nr:hypothetical protein [Thiocapsa sp.]